MKLGWFTDIHLDLLSEQQVSTFVDFARKQILEVDSFIITGDISEARLLKKHLTLLADEIGRYSDLNIVLGNHDYYYGSIEKIREKVSEIPNLTFLTTSDSKNLGNNIILSGHDGWYDGGYGNWFSPNTILMNFDYYTIQELNERKHDQNSLFEKLCSLASEAAEKATKTIAKEANKKYVFCTHVPPFPAASLGPDGKISNEKWLPCFASGILGEALLDLSTDATNLGSSIEVFCGHTHTAADYSPVMGTLRVRTGFSKYRDPISSFKIINL